MFFDLFNGDADGIFALHQYRLSFPANSTLITGVKRDICLLQQLAGTQNAEITVFDVSLDSNRKEIEPLLARRNCIRWFDHHFAGEIPAHAGLHTTIDPSPTTCTSLIVNTTLGESHSGWAICGACGDNLYEAAGHLASKRGFSTKELNQLAELGKLFNYNGYGVTTDDLHFHPKELYRAVAPFADPLAFIAQSEELAVLRDGCAEDLQYATEGERQKIGHHSLYFFPDAPWARRISGIYSNLKARQEPDAAHVIITRVGDNLRLSVRAPLNDRRGADTLCRAFTTGGGRAAAAGINELPPEELSRFIDAFSQTWPS